MGLDGSSGQHKVEVNLPSPLPQKKTPRANAAQNAAAAKKRAKSTNNSKQPSASVRQGALPPALAQALDSKDASAPKRRASSKSVSAKPLVSNASAAAKRSTSTASTAAKPRRVKAVPVRSKVGAKRPVKPAQKAAAKPSAKPITAPQNVQVNTAVEPIVSDTDDAPVTPAHTSAWHRIVFYVSHHVIRVLAIVFALYGLGALLFSTRFLPGTLVNGVSASFKSAEDVSALTLADENDYRLQVEGDGITLNVKGKDIGLAVDKAAHDAGVRELLPGWAWPLQLFGPHELEVTKGVSYEWSKLDKLVDDAVEKLNKGASPAKNASLSYDSAQGGFVAVEEQVGTAANPERVHAAVSHGVDTLQGQVTLGKRELDHPTVFASDPRMEGAVEQADQRIGLALDLTIDGHTMRTIDSNLLYSWLVVGEDYNVTGDLDAITTWTRGELSDQIDTVGTTRAFYRADDGKYIEVSGGTYGWNIDGAQLAETICDRIAQSSSDPIEIPMLSTADVLTKGEPDWTARYIDVDLSEQYVRMFDYDGSLIFEAPCVSGDANLGQDTVTGVYALYDKESPKLLIGLDYDNDGEPDYENLVTYWMPFYGGYGLHDASWRSTFGLDIYLYNGSHGCVNLSEEDAGYLYSICGVGDVVVVHY